mgnify:FL=1
MDFPASAAAADRAKDLVDTVTADGLFEVVAQMDAGAKPEKGLTVMQDLLQAHSDLTAVFCINDECAQVPIPLSQQQATRLKYTVSMQDPKQRQP